MTQQRSARLQAAMQEEISDIIRNRMRDPRIGFVSVTEVEMSPDYKQAKVYISVLGDEDCKKETQAGLESAAGFVRSELGRRIRLRHTPEIVFCLDSSIERGVRISELLHKLKDGQRNEEAP
jgi:ribosome-binding factor A